MAIMRLWHGKVAIEKADEYEKFMISRAAPDYGSVDGLLKLYFQRRNENTIAHFLLVTIWDSMESVKKFAGELPRKLNITQKMILSCLKKKRLRRYMKFFLKSNGRFLIPYL
jgi:heme-degrading monooxygenase HmoA